MERTPDQPGREGAGREAEPASARPPRAATPSAPRGEPWSGAREVTRAVASGDPDAFARLYEHWFDRAYAVARRATGRDESFCLDVVQESFVKMIAKMKPVESDAALAVWVRRVVTRTALDMLRAERRRAAREEHRARTGAEPHDAGERAHADAARIGWLEEELRRLEHEEAQLILARHRFGWTLKSIGETFGLSPGAVDGRISRIVARLRDRAPERHEGEPHD